MWDRDEVSVSPVRGVLHRINRLAPLLRYTHEGEPLVVTVCGRTDTRPVSVGEWDTFERLPRCRRCQP